jgi:hypothetical protein
MKKIFLSLGFSGRTKEEIQKEIEAAKDYIKRSYYPDEEVQFVDNYDYAGSNRVECLGEAIKKMSVCDKVYFINNWFSYKGCLIEKKVCYDYNIPNSQIIIVDSWDPNYNTIMEVE